MKSQSFGVRTLLGERASELEAPEPLEAATVVHGDPARFSAFTELPALRSPTALLAAWDGGYKMGRAWSPGGTTPFELFPTREQAGTLYDAGFTIVLENIESFLPELRPLCRMLERDLGLGPDKVNVEAFFSRRGGHGRPHFDPSFTFNCQVRGDKVWRIARNEAVPFPPVGMFLGRPAEAEIESLLEDELPPNLDHLDPETFVARPGTVVFLPPGVFHETRAEGETFAVAFAIEHVDTVAQEVLKRAKRALVGIPRLRAGRLGAQQGELTIERGLAAAALRELADAIETDPSTLRPDRARVRLRSGLSATAESPTQVLLRGGTSSRSLTLDPSLVTLLDWASRREGAAFDSSDVATELPEIPVELGLGCIRQLVHSRLLERVIDEERGMRANEAGQ